MNKLGLIGGVGPESTIPYYKGIVEGVKDKTGCLPPLTIESLSCFEVIRMSNENDLEGLTAYLLEGINNLAKAGATIGALACNTGHIVFDSLQKNSPIPLISIVEATSKLTKQRGYKKVGLLGTLVTMEKEFFKEPFNREGIEVVIPDKEERLYIANRILNELEEGIINKETQEHILNIVERMVKENYIEAIVLGCTELPLLFNNCITSVPILDTMAIHIDTLVDSITM